MSRKAQYVRFQHAFGFWQKWHIFKRGIAPLCGCKLDEVSPVEIVYEQPAETVCRDCICLENGYRVEQLRGGQWRRYGPTINTFTLADLRGDRTDDEVLAFCRAHLCRAAMKGEDGYHPLVMHVMRFQRNGDGTFTYEAGHEYTG